MKVILQDLEYAHLLYNSFGPITCSIIPSSFTKLQTNNGTGKTILLKTLINLLIPKNGIIYNNINNKIFQNKHVQFNNRLSNSQNKKFKLLNTTNIKKSNLWILDEPYSFLDISSIIYYKKKIITFNNKGGTIIITDCIKKTMLPCIIYYSNLTWI